MQRQILLFLERERHQCQDYVLESRYFHSFSNVAEDHQTKNAKLLLIKGALLLKESELESEFSLVLKRY
jgi:hypothetical protein